MTSPRRRRLRRAVEWPTEHGWQERLSDWSNPLLVRELHEIAHGRIVRVVMFGLGLFLIRQAWVLQHARIAGPGEVNELIARMVVDQLAWATLIPLWMLLPVRAVLSMRHEISGSAADQLALCSVSPLRMVIGKLASSVLLALLVTGMTVPLFAFAGVMRGESVVVLAIGVYIALSTSIALAALSLAAGTLCRHDGMRNAPFAMVTVASTGASLWTLLSIRDVFVWLERTISAGAIPLLVCVTLVAAFVICVCLSICVAAFEHELENRSTRTRVIALVGLLAALALAWSMSGALSATMVRWFLVCGAPFWLFAATEPEELSSVVRQGLPRSRPLRLLFAPLLPGRGRGVLFGCLVIAVTWCGGVSATSSVERGEVHAAALFALAGLGIAASLAARLSAWGARAVFASVALASWILPAVWNAGRGVRLDTWNWLQLANPAAILDRISIEGVTLLSLLVPATLALAGLALSVPVISRGCREVLR